jgi:type IV secretory pathway component VirB8
MQLPDEAVNKACVLAYCAHRFPVDAFELNGQAQKQTLQDCRVPWAQAEGFVLKNQCVSPENTTQTATTQMSKVGTTRGLDQRSKNSISIIMFAAMYISRYRISDDSSKCNEQHQGEIQAQQGGDRRRYDDRGD